MAVTMPIDELHALFSGAITQAFPDLADAASFVEVTRSTQDKFGHYQCNTAMRLAKPLKQAPRAIAQTLMDTVQELDQGSIHHMDIAGPGFINVSLEGSYLASKVQSMLEHPTLGFDAPVDPQRIIIDFSSPNTAKEMHVGHLRSTIIGDCLARLFEYLGHDVLRLNHIGDWGTQFGMLIAYMKEEAPEVLDGKAQTDLSHLVSWYKASKKRFDEDDAFRTRSQKEVVELQGGNEQSLAAWHIICDISRKAYQEIYDKLDVTLIERGESFYNDRLNATVADLEQKGLVEESQGAKCIFLDGFKNRDGDPLPLMVQKSDGGYNYDTTDMAAIRQRTEDEHGDRLIYVTDAGQGQHFKMIFQAAEKAGYVDPSKQRVDHVPFGLVLGPDGKKFKTRSGETERLIDLLNSAVTRARAIVEERSPELPAEEKDQLAEVLGIGAVKYADLSCHRVSDYSFSYERMLRFEGNTAVFLLYAYVRVNGIKRKVGRKPEDLMGTLQMTLSHPSEIALALQIVQFQDLLLHVADDLLPNRLTDYLYELANRFSAFFRDCRVEGSQEQDSRLLLCEAVARVMQTGLHILGVRTVERM